MLFVRAQAVTCCAPLLGCRCGRVLAMHSDRGSIGRPADRKDQKAHGRHVEAFDICSAIRRIALPTFGLLQRPASCALRAWAGKSVVDARPKPETSSTPKRASHVPRPVAGHALSRRLPNRQ
ncbi:hypothetical protein GMOD_00001226 [Pyrenophora seminiperda CCB06]|uniref:Uncharacterized protein n=1 Tax=Pyrenophora seminiperda CCB06 TaxID=1302712 RepID=A0A3M7LYP9_9PLEO|nr:hypothetical protein GMOD_00001226 [Pyrenophora seminiperda CCB06]